MATMNISLPDALKDWVEKQVAGGRYASASDYMRDAVRKDQAREEMNEELVRLGDEGLASGVSKRTVEDIREAVKAEMRMKAKRAV